MKLIFVYGTLKRAGSNHQQLAGQTFVAGARTKRGYRLFDLGSFPGMVVHPEDQKGVEGEVWSIDPACVKRLDEFEGLPQGLFVRQPVPLLPPFAGQIVEAYIYPHSVVGRVDLGSKWNE